MSKDIENYSVRQCHDELVILESPKLPPEQSMYHDMALDVIASRKQRIKERLLRFEQSLAELEELKRDVKDYFRLHSYHYATLPKRSSVQKCKDYPEYDVEMKLFNRLFEKLSKVGNENE